MIVIAGLALLAAWGYVFLLLGGVTFAKWLADRGASSAVGAAAGTALVLAVVAGSGSEGPPPELLRRADAQVERLRSEGVEARTVVLDEAEAKRLMAAATAAGVPFPEGEAHDEGTVTVLRDPPRALHDGLLAIETDRELATATRPVAAVESPVEETPPARVAPPSRGLADLVGR